MRVAMTGASGFVASHLKKRFPDFVVIGREDDTESIVEKLRGVDAVFNLAGAPIIKRWSDPYKKTLISSRIETTKKLVSAINQSEVKAFISTSAIGAYPDGAPYDEDFKGYADDFLGALTRQWEEEAKKCEKPTAIVRFGVVLGKEGGALKEMLLPFRLGLGGTIGDGSMMTSWIDIEDLVAIYALILDNDLTGLFNAVAPHPVSNYAFTKALGEVLHRPTILKVPEFVLRLQYGEGATVLTGSKEVYPKRLLGVGFAFAYPDIRSSLGHLL